MAKASTADETTEDTSSAPELNINVGATPPAELFARQGGAGRTRKETPFDDVLPQIFNEDSEKASWANVDYTDEDHKKDLQNQIKSAANLHDYGLDMRVYEEGSQIWFRARGKSKRGRPKGSRKNPETGKFEVPNGDGTFSEAENQDDDDQNSTPEEF